MKHLLILSFLACLSTDSLIAQTPQVRWRLVEDLRIGSIDDPNHTLTQVGNLVVDSEGRIYVAQPMESTIRVYDRAGRYLRSIGREGGGPGEFRRLSQIGFKADTLWALDRTAHRISFFDTSGEALSSIRVEGPLLRGASQPAAADGVLADGTLLAFPAYRGVPDHLLDLIRMDRSGRQLGTVAKIDVRGATILHRLNDGVIYTPPLMRTHMLRAVSPDGRHVIVVDRPIAERGGESRFFIRKISVQGDTVFSRSYRYPPQAVPSGAADTLVQRTEEFILRFRVEPSDARAMARRHLPRWQTPVNFVSVGANGTIWLQRETLGKQRVQWLVLSPEGNIKAYLDAPRTLEISYATDEYVWGHEHGEFDVPQVVRYRIRTD